MATSPLSSPSRSSSSAVLRRDSVLESLPQFKHAPLDDIEEQIRVCDIQPATNDDAELILTLQTIPLNSPVQQYVCISYVWGFLGDNPPMAKSPDGRCLVVTPNLHALLRRLRAIGLRESLWIDAICINQTNIAEKTQQVSMMGRIYSGAMEVVVALDTTPALAPTAFDHVNITVEGLTAGLHGLHLHELQCFHDDEAGRVLEHLLRSAWFDRAWTIQEIVLSRQAKVLYPGGLLPWRTLTTALQNWHKHRSSCCSWFIESINPNLHDAFYKAYDAVQSITRTQERLPEGLHVLTVAMTFERLEVTDARDAAFAFYGLHTASWSSAKLPRPDYGKTTEDAFTELQLYNLHDWNSLLPLCLEMHSDLALPSWVPDFSSTAPFDANFWRTRLRSYDLYKCAKRLKWSLEYVFPRTLALPGICIGQVQDFTAAADAWKSWKDRSNLLREWLTYYNGSAGPCSTEVDAVFAATLIAGCTGVRTSEGEDVTRRAHEGEIDEWRAFLTSLTQDGPPEDDEEALHPFMHCHIAAAYNRRLFRSMRGGLGLGPRSLRKCDSIWILAGGNVPFILRHVAGDQSPWPEYTLVGPAYVHGIMDGQAYSPKAKVELCHLV